MHNRIPSSVNPHLQPSRDLLHHKKCSLYSLGNLFQRRMQCPAKLGGSPPFSQVNLPPLKRLYPPALEVLKVTNTAGLLFCIKSILHWRIDSHSRKRFLAWYFSHTSWLKNSSSCSFCPTVPTVPRIAKP